MDIVPLYFVPPKIARKQNLSVLFLISILLQLVFFVACTAPEESAKAADSAEAKVDNGTTNTDNKSDSSSDNTSNSSDVSNSNDNSSGSNSSFTITSTLCNDEKGPDCYKLRLGDDYLTTSTPAKGYLFSCSGKNPNAPGSIESKITWIDFATKTWNFLKKLWLPPGTFNPAAGTYKEAISGDNRSIKINNLPVDAKVGDWPMTNYAELTAIDQNPGVPSAGNYSFSYLLNPTEASSPSCLSLGAIGVTKNGVIIYNASDARGEDAVAREIVDKFGGHLAQSEYHYHFIQERLDNETLSDGHSGIVGYINDGFPIYGYKGVGGIEMSNDDLDLCHGHKHGTLGYHYHATIEYPYTAGCYKGTPVSNSSGSTAKDPCAGHGETWGPGIGPPPAGCGGRPPPR